MEEEAERPLNDRQEFLQTHKASFEILDLSSVVPYLEEAEVLDSKAAKRIKNSTDSSEALDLLIKELCIYRDFFYFHQYLVSINKQDLAALISPLIASAEVEEWTGEKKEEEEINREEAVPFEQVREQYIAANCDMEQFRGFIDPTEDASAEKKNEAGNEEEQWNGGGQVAANKVGCIDDKFIDLGSIKVAIHGSQVIGDGGFGFVYEGTNISTMETVAVKILKRTDYGKKEFNILNAIHGRGSPRNFVRPLAGQIVDEAFILVLELLGPSLWDILNKMEHLPLREIATLTYQMTSALDFLHGLNICHADIKPDNILTRSGVTVNEKGDIVAVDRPVFVLIDFNTALPMTSDKECHHLVGTTPYRAPEVVMDIPWTRQVDIFGLGLVIAECIDGELMVEFELYDRTVLTLAERFQHLRLLEEALGPLRRRLFTRSKIIEIVLYFELYVPMAEARSKLDNKLRSMDEDDEMTDLLCYLIPMMLELDPKCRPTAKELLELDILKRFARIDLGLDGVEEEENKVDGDGEEMREEGAGEDQEIGQEEGIKETIQVDKEGSVEKKMVEEAVEENERVLEEDMKPLEAELMSDEEVFASLVKETVDQIVKCVSDSISMEKENEMVLEEMDVTVMEVEMMDEEVIIDSQEMEAMEMVARSVGDNDLNEREADKEAAEKENESVLEKEVVRPLEMNEMSKEEVIAKREAEALERIARSTGDISLNKSVLEEKVVKPLEKNDVEVSDKREKAVAARSTAGGDRGSVVQKRERQNDFGTPQNNGIAPSVPDVTAPLSSKRIRRATRPFSPPC